MAKELKINIYEKPLITASPIVKNAVVYYFIILLLK